MYCEDFSINEYILKCKQIYIYKGKCKEKIDGSVESYSQFLIESVNLP